MTSSEVSNPGRARLPYGPPPTGPVGIAAREFFSMDEAPLDPPSATTLRPVIDEPYVYGAKTAAKWPSTAWMLTGVVAVAGLVILVSGRSEVSAKDAELAKAKSDLVALTTTTTSQAGRIAALEQEKAATATVLAARDRDVADAEKRADSMRRAAVSAADDAKRAEAKASADAASRTKSARGGNSNSKSAHRSSTKR